MGAMGQLTLSAGAGYLLQQEPDMTSDPSTGAPAPAHHASSHNPLRNSNMDNDRYSSVSNGVSGRQGAGPAGRQAQLGLFSRAFEMFTSPPSSTPYRPSKTLQDAHQARLMALRDARVQEPQPGPALAASTSTTNGSIHSKPPPQGEPSSFDIIEKPEAPEEPGSVPPPDEVEQDGQMERHRRHERRG
ncbi:unnamed protein product [Parascedosporium putredinis]|uniref:Uncharacterized protein n=1 Tax=Parascedosporium putredinis TaxID=1442378 RepID=A0A9P1MCG5_9PEZI|nr:unnamed protein product [Parascedosporium putredinis]CAI7996505.1 unnamed protein product [Parascedosporium putredinis]